MNVDVKLFILIIVYWKHMSTENLIVHESSIVFIIFVSSLLNRSIMYGIEDFLYLSVFGMAVIFCKGLP